MRYRLAIAAIGALAVPGAEANAQLFGTVRVRAGLGAQVGPEYPGADKLEISPYPTLSVAFGEKPFGFGAPDDSFGIGLLGKGGLSVGPVLALKGGRKESEVGAPVGEVSRTVEVGLFAQQEFGSSFRVRGELRKGIGGHEGFAGHVGADKIWRDGDKYVISIGPRVLFSDAKYQRAFFGVGPEAALASGLPEYRPGGGIHALAAASGLRYEIGGGWGLFGYARYERLVGDARKLPIVREFGSPNQFSAGIGVSRIFTIKL